MRIILIGPTVARARLRARLAPGLAVVGEAASATAARALDVDADAWLVAVDAPGGPEAADAPVEPLTPREREVLALTAEGLSNRAIGDRLGISGQTVKFHVASLCGKLGAANRTDAVRRGIARGIVPL